MQVGSHVFNQHQMLAREYREYFGLEVKRGTVPDWYRKEKGDTAIQNETYKNILTAGEKFRFKKGQEGVGVYDRSPITLARVSLLGKKTWKKNNPKIIDKTDTPCTDISIGV